LYTRGGDKGETGLFGARRIGKDSPRVEAYGAIDELNSCVGVALAECKNEEISNSLREIQSLLFIVGADLATEIKHGTNERVPRITREHTQKLEKEIDSLLAKLPKLSNFILPGGSKLSAQIHFARAVCRRAERRIVTVSKIERINPEILPFINRLSTYLFNLARFANLEEGKEDNVWKSD
jgi:cob(I)alamin adenosyltransferase